MTKWREQYENQTYPPVSFARNSPSSSYAEQSKPPRNDPRVVKFFFAFGASLLILMIVSLWNLGNWVSANAPETHEEAGAMIGYATNTPQPTITQYPTNTPFPTREKGSPTPQIQIMEVEVEKVVTVIVTQEVKIERVITTTPEPTPTKEPSPTATEKPLWLQASENDQRNQMRLDNALVRLVEILLSPIMVFMYALIALALIGWLALGRFQRVLEMPRETRVEESAEEILGRSDIRIDHILQILSRSMKKYGAGGYQLVGYRETDLYANQWTDAIALMRESGCKIAAKSGKGTILLSGTLNEWHNFFRYPPTPPPPLPTPSKPLFQA